MPPEINTRQVIQKMQNVLKQYPTEMLILELGDRGKVLHHTVCSGCERMVEIEEPLLLLEVN